MRGLGEITSNPVRLNNMENNTEKTDVEQITNEFEEQMKEFAHWIGGWDELRKVIDRLEDNDNEAAFERYCTDY